MEKRSEDLNNDPSEDPSKDPSKDVSKDLDEEVIIDLEQASEKFNSLLKVKGACSRKVTYELDEVEEVARERTITARISIYYYNCIMCGKYHLTSKRRREKTDVRTD